MLAAHSPPCHLQSIGWADVLIRAASDGCRSGSKGLRLDVRLEYVTAVTQMRFK